METVPAETVDVAACVQQQAQAKPMEAIELITSRFDHYYALIFKYLLNRLFDRELAEELTAQTCYKAAVHHKKIPSDPKQIEYWLIRVATNLANTHYRKGNWYRLLLSRFARTKSTSEEPNENKEDQQKQQIRGMIKALPPKDQTMVVLRYFHQMSFEEIAAVLNVRPDAVRARLSRAINKMRIRR